MVSNFDPKIVPSGFKIVEIATWTELPFMRPKKGYPSNLDLAL